MSSIHGCNVFFCVLKTKSIMAGSRSIVMLGDSVLDSTIWISKVRNDTAHYLRELGYRTDDYSTDGNRVVDMDTTTGKARRAFILHRRIYNLPGYRDVSFEDLPSSDVTILSILGNDVLHCMRRICLTAESIERDLLARDVLGRFDQLVAKASRRSGKLILIAPYMPNRRDPVGWALGSMFEKLAPRLFSNYHYASARRHGAMVVDLSLSFNPFVDQLYGSTAIEPSEAGSHLIAELVAHADRNFVPGTGLRWTQNGPESFGLYEEQEYKDKLVRHIEQSRAMPRSHIPLERRVWKLHRTLYFHALQFPVSLTRIAYLLGIVHLVRAHQRERVTVGDQED